MITMADIRHADGRMQLDVTALGYSDPPEWEELRREMCAVAKKHFNNKPFREIANEPAPKSVLNIFRKMCEIVEQNGLNCNYQAPLKV